MTRGVGAAQPVGVVGAEYGKCMSWRGVAALAIVEAQHFEAIHKMVSSNLEEYVVPKNGREVSRTTHPNSSFPSIACVH